MKKTLIAVAALSAMTASAMAADVTLYGRMDMGIQVNKVTGSKVTTKMQTGQSSGNRWGIKTTEDLGNGYKVGVVLESGFSADDGSSAQGGRLFGRDAFMQIDTPYGQVRAGRTGTLSDGCTGDMVAGKMTPFGTTYGYAAATNSLFNQVTRVNNAIRLATPKYAGFQAAAEYANNTETGRDATTDRYVGVGASYSAGNLYVAAVYDEYRLDNRLEGNDAVTATLAANYNFGVAKVFAGYQYAKHVSAEGLNTKLAVENDDAKANVFMLGASAPVCGGTAMASVQYIKGEQIDTKDSDFSKATYSIGYKYSVSKRTTLYTAASYVSDKFEKAGQKDSKGKALFFRF